MSRLGGEAGRFLGVGGATVLIDFVSYRLLMFAATPAGAAKAGGFIIGTVFAYFANRLFTFRVNRGKADLFEIVRFALCYGASLLVNVWMNGFVLRQLGMSELGVAAAFVAATGLSATMNFLGMKFVVFRSPAKDEAT